MQAEIELRAILKDKGEQPGQQKGDLLGVVVSKFLARLGQGGLDMVTASVMDPRQLR